MIAPLSMYQIAREARRMRADAVAPSIQEEFRAAVAQVGAGHCRRICMPGRWVVWMPEGETNPHARIFNHQPHQGATLCRCS